MKTNTPRVHLWALVVAPALLAMPACDEVEDEGTLPRVADSEELAFDAEMDDEQEAVDPNAQGDDGLALTSPAPDPLQASTLDHLNSCEWKKASTSTDRFLYVECEAYQNPIAGGCHNSTDSATIQSSMPFENGSLNFPENGEAWFNLGFDSGWRCKKDGDAGTLTGVAMCCGLAPEG